MKAGAGDIEAPRDAVTGVGCGFEERLVVQSVASDGGSPLNDRRELYVSQNGDRWDVHRDTSGKLEVVHCANRASGGAASSMDVATFLAQRHNLGPEHQALLSLLRSGSLDIGIPAFPGNE